MRWIYQIMALAACALSASAAPLTAALSEDEKLVASLIETLDDSDSVVRQNIAVAIANLGEVAVPALIDALNHPLPERRMGAATALGLTRPAAKSAIPALLRAMKDKNDGVRRNASYALSRIVGRDASFPPTTSERYSNVPPLEPTPNSSTNGVK